jgi:hypothetical protein
MPLIKVCHMQTYFCGILTRRDMFNFICFSRRHLQKWGIFLPGYMLRKYEKSTGFGALRQNMLSLIGCLFFHME